MAGKNPKDTHDLYQVRFPPWDGVVDLSYPLLKRSAVESFSSFRCRPIRFGLINAQFTPYSKTASIMASTFSGDWHDRRNSH